MPSNDSLSCVSDNQSSELSSSEVQPKDLNFEASPKLMMNTVKCITPIENQNKDEGLSVGKALPRRNQSVCKRELTKAFPVPPNFNFRLETADFEKGSQ